MGFVGHPPLTLDASASAHPLVLSWGHLISVHYLDPSIDSSEMSSFLCS